MTSTEVVELYKALGNLAIKIWIDGGWAVDALLGKQTRTHNDLDIAIEWKDAPSLREILEARGYKQIREDSRWNFVMGDEAGREIDVHAFVYDDSGNVVEGIMYPAESLTGSGTIDGFNVSCISPKYMVEFLTPWVFKHPGKYLAAVPAIAEKFEIPIPAEYRQIQSALTEKKLNGISFFVLPQEQIPKYVFDVCQGEWDKEDFVKYGDDLYKATWQIEKILVDKIKVNEEMLKSDAFQKDVQPRIVKQKELYAAGVPMNPLILRGSDLLIFDGYARWHLLKQLGAKHCMAYVGRREQNS